MRKHYEVALMRYYGKREDFDMRHREDIGSQIQTMRVQLGLTAEELAAMCGMTLLNIRKIENGVYNVPIDVVGKIADALKAKIIIQR